MTISGRAVAALAAAAVLLFTLLVQPLSGGTAIAQTGEAEANGSIRFVHASPDAPEIDVLVDGDAMAQALAFGVATEYAALSPGEHHVQIVPAGEGPDSALVEETVDVDSGAAYIVAIANLLNSIELKTIESNLDDLDEGKSRLRVVNLSPGDHEFDIVEVGGDSWFDDLEFGEASDHRDVDEGQYSVEVRPGDAELAELSADLQIDAGNEYTLLLIGTAADDTLAVLPLSISVQTACAVVLGIGDESDDACVRIIHAAADGPAVDIYLEDSLIVEGLEPGASSDFIGAPADGERSVKLVPAAGALEDAIIESSVELDARMATDIIIGGSVEDLKVVNDTLDLSPLPVDQARVRLVNLSHDAGDLDLLVTDGDALFEDVGFESFTDSIIVDAGNYDLQLRNAGEDEVLFRSSDIAFDAGMVYDLIVSGSEDAGTLTILVVSAPAETREGDVAATAGASTPVGQTDTADEAEETTPTPLSESEPEGTPSS